jgi:hypothetical protein
VLSEPAEKYTLAEAFDYFQGPSDREQHDRLNVERGLRSVAFLLTWCSDIGNQPVDGNAANGLARILELCADRAAFSGKSSR